jgi:hypothetical protein
VKSDRKMSCGRLAHCMIVASGLLALVVGAAFAILLISITDLHGS